MDKTLQPESRDLDQPAQGRLGALVTPLLLAALSLALTLHNLAADSFWGDEIFTGSYAGRPPAEVIRWTAGDIHPPLYYLIAAAFTRLTLPLGAAAGPNLVSDWLWRFPSAAATVLAVVVTYNLAKRLTLFSSISGAGERDRFVRATAATAALLLCLSPAAIKYSQEARMHAPFMVLSALSTWLFCRALARPQQWRRWLAYGLATTAGIYTMYFGFLVLAIQAGLLFFLNLDASLKRQKLDRHQLLGFGGAVLLACLLYGPWWPALFTILGERAAVGAIEGGVGSPLTFVPGVIRALGPAPAAWLFLGLFGLGLTFLIRRSWPMAAFAALWLALPILLPILLGDPRALQFRYAFVLPVYLTVVAYALVTISTLLSDYLARRRTADSPSIQTAPAQPPNPPTSPASNLLIYLAWLLVTLSFIATLDVYNQTKPDWRGAAAYLEERTAPDDIILTGPLWDEGRFIAYYYRGRARLLTPAAFVANIERYAAEMRAGGGRLWAVNRFAPAELPALNNLPFSGVVLSEPQLPVYEPPLLAGAALDLARQAVAAAYPWAAAAEAQGVLNPDPRTARAAALRAWGDALVAAGRPEEALAPYQTAVEIFPGWVSGFMALAETQEAVGNIAAAAQAYRQAVSFNSKWQGPEADRASELVAAGRWAAALERYHQIIDGE